MNNQNNSKGRWSVAQARRHLSELLRSAEKEPQTVYNRDRLAAVVLGPKTYKVFQQWKEQDSRRSLAEATEKIRTLMAEEQIELEILPRKDRPNAFLEILDDGPD